jgi:hypothetical protein
VVESQRLNLGWIGLGKETNVSVRSSLGLGQRFAEEAARIGCKFLTGTRAKIRD